MRYTLLSLIILVFLTQCKEVEESSSFDEGVIVYEVTFPFNQDDLLIHLFPGEMMMEFKQDKIHGRLKTVGNIVQTDFIVDNKSREFSQLLKAFEDRYVLSLDEKGVAQMLETMPKMKLIPTEETDSLAGYLCRMTIAEFTTDSVPSIELWHTNEIDIESPNWCNQFNGLDEVLLGYEIEEYGMRMRLRAKEVKYIEVSDEQFAVPSDHNSVDLANMRAKIFELMETYMK